MSEIIKRGSVVGLVVRDDEDRTPGATRAVAADRSTPQVVPAPPAVCPQYEQIVVAPRLSEELRPRLSDRHHHAHRNVAGDPTDGLVQARGDKCAAFLRPDGRLAKCLLLRDGDVHPPRRVKAAVDGRWRPGDLNRTAGMHNAKFCPPTASLQDRLTERRPACR